MMLSDNNNEMPAENLLPAMTWAWTNRAEIKAWLKKINEWFRGNEGLQQKVVILGAGGVGKTTLARILTGEFEWLIDSPWKYEESYNVERKKIGEGKKFDCLVMPGQKIRRDVHWEEIQKEIADGKVCGVIIVSANGYHTPNFKSYKQHSLYNGTISEFRKAYLEANVVEEINIYEQVCSHIAASPSRIWLLSVVTKEDLWKKDRDSIQQRFSLGKIHHILEMVSNKKLSNFRHELCLTSLVISNLKTIENEILFNI